MDHLAIPVFVFIVIEAVAYAQGLSALATLALSGAWLCCGMQLGWWAWERTKRKRPNRSDERKTVA